MGRAPCCDKANVKKGPWSPEEDAKLKAYIEQHGTGGNWIALPQKIGLKRCGKSCRLRWLNYLRPNIKHGGFSEEEDNLICSLYISIGSRWSIIAAQLPGRTDNDIKNYWNTRLKKKLLGRRKDSHMRRISGVNHDSRDGDGGLNESQSSAGFSASALERMQLHMQLQGLQNPFSFYNSPALWPKLQLLGERLSNFRSPADGDINSTSPVQQTHNFQAPNMDPTCIQQTCTFSGELKQGDVSNSINGLSSSSSPMAYGGCDPSHLSVMSNTDFQIEGGMQSEFSEMINKTSEVLGHGQDQSYELDCLKEIMDPKEGNSWWGNDFDVQSSSSSWESASVFQPQGMMFQAYLMGYDL